MKYFEADNLLSNLGYLLLLSYCTGEIIHSAGLVQDQVSSQTHRLSAQAHPSLGHLSANVRLHCYTMSLLWLRHILTANTQTVKTAGVLCVCVITELSIISRPGAD